MPYSRLLAAASALSLLTALLHALVGGRQILGPVLRAPLPRLVRHVVEVVWHMLTWHLLLLGAGLAWAASRPEAAWAVVLGVVSAVTTLGYGALFLGFALARFGDPRRMPQWLLFLPIGALALLANVFGSVPSPALSDAAAVAAAAVLFALALLHLLWASGSSWPLPNRNELSLTVVGEPSYKLPARGTTVVMAGMLAFAALWVLSLRGLWISLPGRGPLSSLVTWGLVSALGLRGVGGFFEPMLRPAIRGTPYLRWSLRLYSPLSAGLATAVAIAAA